MFFDWMCGCVDDWGIDLRIGDWKFEIGDWDCRII